MNHPLGTIKDLTTATVVWGVSLPIRLAARAFGVARGAASVGMQVAQDVAGRSASGGAAPVVVEPQPERTDLSEPVNVVEELGLDPAPVDETATRSSDAEEPVTSIDAQADPGQVEATPADVAERISAPVSEARHSE